MTGINIELINNIFEGHAENVYLKGKIRDQMSSQGHEQDGTDILIWPYMIEGTSVGSDRGVGFPFVHFQTSPAKCIQLNCGCEPRQSALSLSPCMCPMTQEWPPLILATY